MSKSLNSPTARLLQSSRLFSLPRPLPQPALETVTSTGVYRSSDTATLPYPTHQSISSPPSSQHQGDWGLKRALPAKAARSAIKHIRVKAQDNVYHITDYESAASYTQTEVKWQQMGIPLVLKEDRKSYSGNKSVQSVYDDNVDNTDPEAVRLRAGASVEEAALQSDRMRGARRAVIEPVQWKRWKYNSPWVAGMQEGEFELYVQRQLEFRKDEFRQFLTQRILRNRIQDEERTLRDRGERRSLTPIRKEQLFREIQRNYDAEEKRLRDDHAVQQLSSELTAAIIDFLDLPGVDGADVHSSAQNAELRRFSTGIASSASKPPSTHPGAGLSHLRSNAFMENHPFWGPQAHSTPVLARVVRPRNNAGGLEHQAKIGVGGVVTNDPTPSSYRNTKGPDLENIEENWLEPEQMATAIEPDLPGGNKLWVQPQTASIDDQGRIRLDINRGDKEAIAVARNKVEPIHEARSATTRSPASMAPPGTAGNANYGYSLPDTRGTAPRATGAPRSNVRGFDQELGRRPQQGQMENEGVAAAKIKELMGDAFRR